MLAGALGQCFSLAELNLFNNGIGAEGAGRLAGVLGQFSSFVVLNLSHCCILAEEAGRLAGGPGQCSPCWPDDSVLEIDNQFY